MKTLPRFKSISLIIPLFLLVFSTTSYSESKKQVEEKAGKDESKAETLYSSVEERRLHSLMKMEQETLIKEKKDLELKEKELKTLEAAVDKKIDEIDSKLSEMRVLQKKIEELLAEKSLEEKKRIQDLGKIYEKMIPEKAAQAIAGLKQQLATELLGAMKPKAAAKVLNMLDRNKAAQISTTFSTIPVE